MTHEQPKVRTLFDEIIDGMFDQLQNDIDFDANVLAELRKASEAGKLSKAPEVQKIIQSVVQGWKNETS